MSCSSDSATTDGGKYRAPSALGESETRELLNRLHIAKDIMGKPKLVLSGNRMDDGHSGEVYLYAGTPRIYLHLNSDSTKADELRSFSQDALKAAAALANIADAVAPCVWREKSELAKSSKGPQFGVLTSDFEAPVYPAQVFKVVDKNAGSWEKLIEEVGNFVDRFGLLHMASGECPLGNSNWLAHERIEFIGDDFPTLESYKRERTEALLDEDARIERALYDSVVKESGAPADGLSSIPDDIKREAKDVKYAAKERHERKIKDVGSSNLDEHYAAELKRFAKIYKGSRKYEKLLASERERLDPLERELDSLKLERQMRRLLDADEVIEARDERIAELQSEVKLVHPDIKELIKASQNAAWEYRDTAPVLEKYGVWRVNSLSFYGCALLVHDALEMLRAMKGDEGAFSRILAKFHMERFFPQGVEDFDRYTLWFESVGYDVDNPDPYKGRYSYTEVIGGVPTTLTRRTIHGEWRGFGGTDWMFYRLCEPGEDCRDFERLVRKHLPYFLKEMVEEGMRRNYRGAYAPAAPISGDNTTYRVNDREHDLMATIWSAIDLVRRGDVNLTFIRCLRCWKFAVRERSRKQFCSNKCRSYNNKCKSVDDLPLLKEHLEYMASGSEIRLGVDEPSDGRLKSHFRRVINRASGAIRQ